MMEIKSEDGQSGGSEDCYSEDTFETVKCHICNVEVPVLCFERHNESEKHVTLKTIFQKVLERAYKQINISVIHNDEDLDEDVYFCVPCSKIIRIQNQLKHESSEYHVKSRRGIDLVHEFYKIFEENSGYVGAKEIGKKENLDEKRDHTNTMKQSCTVDRLVRNENHNKELTSEEKYFNDMVKKYNLKLNLPIVDGDFIQVASPIGIIVKISRDRFHSYQSKVEGNRVYCQMCTTWFELGEESRHKVTEKHVRNIFSPVNEKFVRSLSDSSIHCLICNKVTRLLGIHICQNSEDLANSINTENIGQTHSENKINYPVDTLKLKAVTQKNLNNIKLATHNSAWNHGSGTENNAQANSSSIFSIRKNMHSVLEKVPSDPTSIRANRDITPNYSKGASIERSTFISRGNFTASGSSSRSGSVGVARSNFGMRSTSAAPTTPLGANQAPAPVAPAPVPQEPLPEHMKKSIKYMIDLCIINSDDVEMVAEVKQLYTAQYHAAVVNEILNIAVNKSAKVVPSMSKALLSLVASNTISPDNFVAGIKEVFEFAPDLYIDIPMLYDHLGKIIAPQIEKKHITFVQLFRLSESIISAKHGHLFLKALIRYLKESMGPSFVQSKWQESGLQIKQWMDEKLVTAWLEDNNFEFLEGDSRVSEETKKILTPAQTQTKLIKLMEAGETCDCNKGWIQLSDSSIHCLICNKVTSLLNIHICQNNENLANSINTENIGQTHSENKRNKCVNNKKYISKLDLSENDLGDHLKRLVICELCKVSVPQDQIEYHNAGTPHWSNAFKNICTNVADGLQSFFKDSLKTDSDLSGKQNYVPKNNITKQNDISENDNGAKQNDIPKNDNVAKQNDIISENDNGAKQNDIPKNDNVAKQNDIIYENDNGAKQNDIPKNDNVGKQNDTSENNNVTNQNDISKQNDIISENDNVAKQNDISENDNLANQNNILENDDAASSSVSNIANYANIIDPSRPFRFADSTKNNITCIVCDIDIPNDPRSITNHEASSNHKLCLRKLFMFHTIKEDGPYHHQCKCCNILILMKPSWTNIWAHIGTEQHTALLQTRYETDSEILKLYVHKSKERSSLGIMYRELYKMWLQSNQMCKISHSYFYCSLCERELSAVGDEIDHMLTEAHEKLLKNFLKVE